MARFSVNENRQHNHQTLPIERDIIADSDSSYVSQISRRVYTDIWSNFTESLISSSVKSIPVDTNILKESYSTLEDANGSGNIFPLSILLEESWWNIFDEKYLRYSWEWTVTLISAYMFILIAGVIGNAMVILVVLLRPTMRTVTNMFIMNLAVADLFVILFCVGPTLLANIFKPWILGSFMCKGVAYVQGVSVCASAYSLVAISLDRCYAVYRPLERYRGVSKCQALKLISLIWIIAISLTLPWAVIFNIVISEKDGLVYCHETWENDYNGNLYFLIVNLLLCYGLPLLIISISNLVVWCHVTNRNVPQESVSAANIVKKVHQRARENVRKMLSIVTLTFLISWLPLYILVSRLKFASNISESEENLIDLMMPFAQWFGSLNSCVNPIIYAFLNRKFREEFYLLLPSCFGISHFNKVIGVGTERYGVQVSSRNLPKMYRYPECQSRTSVRSNRKTHNSSILLVSSFRKSTEQISAKLVGRSMSFSGNSKYNVTNTRASIGKTMITSGTITDL